MRAVLLLACLAVNIVSQLLTVITTVQIFFSVLCWSENFEFIQRRECGCRHRRWKFYFEGVSLYGRVSPLLGIAMRSEIMDQPGFSSSSSYFSDDLCFPNEVLNYCFTVHIPIFSRVKIRDSLQSKGDLCTNQCVIKNLKLLICPYC